MEVDYTMNNVLLVAPSSMYGGGEVYIKNLALYLKKEFKCTVYLLANNNRLIGELSDSVDSVFKCKDSASQKNKLLNAFLISKLTLKYKIETVFLNGLPESGLLAFLTYSKRTVCIGHSNESELAKLNKKSGFYNWLLKLMFRYSFNKIDAFICINKLAQKNVLQFLPNYKKSYVIYNGVPPVNIKKKKRKIEHSLSVGRICRLTKDKNVELAIDAIPKLNGDVNLLVAGEGEHLSILQDYASNLPVTFLGHIQAEQFYNEIDVMLLTTPESSNADATPLVILEAMSIGIPVISTRVGGVPELIEDGVSGLLCDDSAEAFSEAILSLANNHALYDKLSIGAKNRYNDKFTLEVMMNKTYQLLVS